MSHSSLSRPVAGEVRRCSNVGIPSCFRHQRVVSSSECLRFEPRGHYGAVPEEDCGFVADPNETHYTVEGNGSLTFEWNKHGLTSFFTSVTKLLYQTCAEEEPEMKLRKFNARRMVVSIIVGIRDEWKTFVAVTAGNAINAIAVVFFVLPYRFPDLGVSGLAVLSNYVFNISPAWVLLAGNAVLMAWAWKELSPRFVIWTAYSVILTAFLLKVFEFIPLPDLSDRFLAAVASGVLHGVGGGIIFRVGASSGGLDIPAVALRRRYGIELGQFSIYVNLFILLLSLFIVGFDAVVYGIVGLYVYGIVVDNIMRSFDRRKQVLIVSAAPRQIADFITHSVGRGVTILRGEGGYTGEERQLLLSFLEPRQVIFLKKYLASADPKAFMAISDASEVLGKGFKNWKAL